MSNFNFSSYSLDSFHYSDTIKKILQATMHAADPQDAIKRRIAVEDDRIRVAGKSYSLAEYRRIFVIGFGKAVLPMAQAVTALLGNWVKGGVMISKVTSFADPIILADHIRILKGSHPVPDENSVHSTQELVNFLKDLQPDDLVICLISGGGSSLLTLPVEGVQLEDLRELTRILLVAGAEIGEINTLRKHLDQVKGGGLARLVYPAHLVTLILSDVIGNPLDVISSGPTVADSSTYEDALRVLRKYNLEAQVPPRILQKLQAGKQGKIPETVKPGDVCLSRVQNVIISSNYQVARMALEVAQTEGLNPLLLTTFLHGEAHQAGLFLASVMRQIAASRQPVSPPACVIAGGETTVTIKGNGLGGRNLEVGLGAVFDLAGVEKAVLVTLATDGEDGPTDASGAVVTGHTFERGRKLGLTPNVYLQNNDSYRYFEALDDLIKTGPTGTNVNDLAFLFLF